MYARGKDELGTRCRLGGGERSNENCSVRDTAGLSPCRTRGYSAPSYSEKSGDKVETSETVAGDRWATVHGIASQSCE